MDRWYYWLQTIAKFFTGTIENDDLVEDGFGTSASAVCPICGCRAVYVCRPGDIRCGVCYDGNPKEYYTGTECEECTMNAVHNGKCICCGDKNA